MDEMTRIVGATMNVLAGHFGVPDLEEITTADVVTLVAQEVALPAPDTCGGALRLARRQMLD